MALAKITYLIALAGKKRVIKRLEGILTAGLRQRGGESGSPICAIIYNLASYLHIYNLIFSVCQVSDELK